MSENINFPNKGEYSMTLNDLLTKIIDLDKEGREITAHAEESRLQAEVKVAEQVTAMRAEYKERTKNRLAIIEQDERSRAETALKTGMERSEQTVARLDKLFEENGDKWAEEMFSRVVEIG